ADSATDARKDIECDRGAVVAGLMHCAAECGLALGFIVLLDELTDLVNDGDGVEIAFALRVAPGEETVAAEDNAVAAGILLDSAFQHHSQLKSRSLPGKPDELVAELLVELLHLLLAIRGRGERDGPVRMQMVDVRSGQVAVQGGVD